MERRYAIGNFICELRQEKGFTQKELGDLLGVTNKAVSKWETGAALPRLDTLRELADILGCTQEELLLGQRIDKADEQPETSPEAAATPPAQSAKPKRIINCRHVPKDVVVQTVFKENVCKRCGQRFYYDNRRLLAALVIALAVALPALVAFIFYKVADLLNEAPVLIILISPGLMMAAICLFRLFAKLILVHVGKTVTLPNYDRKD